MSVKQNVKGQDIAARYGGEEFAVALPNTALRSAITVADQIRRAVMTKELMKRSSGERLGRVTISIGVALLRPADTAQSLIERADKCLYAAKRNGRNQRDLRKRSRGGRQVQSHGGPRGVTKAENLRVALSLDRIGSHCSSSPDQRKFCV